MKRMLKILCPAILMVLLLVLVTMLIRRMQGVRPVVTVSELMPTPAPSAVPTATPAPTATPVPAPTATVVQTEAPSTPEPLQTDWVAQLELAGQTDQVIVVGVSGTTAEVSYHVQGTDGVWEEQFVTNGYIGANGQGKTAEGDGKTPTGAFHFTCAFGISADPGCPLGYLQVDSSYYWVDDPNSQYYNKLVTTEQVQKDWSSAERITAVGSAYNYVLALDYNSECVPGLGSAIFLHCSRGRATAGCVAIPEQQMEQVLRTVSANCIIIIDTPEGILTY